MEANLVVVVWHASQPAFLGSELPTLRCTDLGLPRFDVCGLALLLRLEMAICCFLATVIRPWCRFVSVLSVVLWSL